MSSWISLIIGIVIGITLIVGLGLFILAKDDHKKDLKPFNTEKVFETFAEANEVLKQMQEILDRFKVVSVADFLEIVEMESRYTDQYYGWKDLRKAKTVKVKNGYMLYLPDLKGIR